MQKYAISLISHLSARCFKHVFSPIKMSSSFYYSLKFNTIAVSRVKTNRVPFGKFASPHAAFVGKAISWAVVVLIAFTRYSLTTPESNVPTLTREPRRSRINDFASVVKLVTAIARRAEDGPS